MRPRRAAYAAGAWLRGARPAPLLAALALAQLCVVAWLAFATPHNGWVWYSGGDATEYWTSQWSVAHGLIPQALVGWGLPVLYAWVPLVGGASLLTALPAIVLFHALVLGPLALVLVWALADRLYGRMYAWAVALLWVTGPLLALWAFTPRYRPRFEESVLAPHWAGLTDMADFPSLVAVLATAWATVRAVQNGRFGSALGAGVIGGILLGLKPANGYFLPAVVVLLVAWRRPRVALGWAAGVAPAVLTLIVWKARGLGTLPLLSAYAPTRHASGAVIALSTDRYLPLDWHHLSLEWAQLREVFWDLRSLQFLLVAGALGALRRSPRAGVFLVVWFVAFCVFKGMSNQADITTTSYFRLTLPGFAALVLLVPAIVFLWPGASGRRTDEATESWAVRPRASLSVVGVLAAVVPLAVVLVAQPASTDRIARFELQSTEAPISSSLTPRVTRSGTTVRIEWGRAARADGTKVSYAVIRTTRGDGCSAPPQGARECVLTAPIVISTSATTATDKPGRGRFWYRVGAVADNRANANSTDLMLVGPAVSVRV